MKIIIFFYIIVDVIFETKRHEVESDSALFLSVLVWATAGYEFTGILAQQTKTPSTTYPLVMFLVVFMMIFVYSMPVFISLTTYPDYEYVSRNVFVFEKKNINLIKIS